VAWWLRGERRFGRYLAWALCAALVLIPYAVEYIWFPSSEHKPAPFLIGYILHFTLAFIGSAVSGSERYVGLSVALPAGIIGLLALVGLPLVFHRLARRNIAPMIPWLALAVFVLVAGFAAGVGRAVNEGVFTARAARFDPVSGLFWIAMLAMLAILLDHFWEGEERQAQIFRMGGALLVLFMGLGWMQRQFNVIEYFVSTTEIIGNANDCLLTGYENAPDSCLLAVNPLPQYVREYVKNLADRGERIAWLIPRQFPLSKATVDHPNLVSFQTRQLDDTRTPTIFAHAPSQLNWTYTVPQAQRVTLRTGVLLDIPPNYVNAPSDGVTFEIAVNVGEETKTLFQQHVAPRVPGQGFQPVEVDLTPYAGQTIHLIFNTVPGASDSYDWALWSPPEIALR
jgi:hypothetical protein